MGGREGELSLHQQGGSFPTLTLGALQPLLPCVMESGLVLPPPLPSLVLPLPFSLPCSSHPRPSDQQQESLSACHHLHHPGGPSLPAPGPLGWASAEHQGWAQRWVLPQRSQGEIPPGRTVWCCRGVSARVVSERHRQRWGDETVCCHLHMCCPTECLSVGHQQQGLERAQRWGELAMG